MGALILFLALALVRVDASEAAASLYNEANARYRAGDYGAALGLYERALATGVRNPRLHYNLGNAAFKAGRLGRAVVAYERALRLAPDDEDVRANLALVRERAVDRFDTGEENIVTAAALGVYRALTLDGLAVTASLCLFGLAVAGLTALYRPAARTFAIVAAAACLVVGGASAGLLALKASDLSRPEAVIVAGAVEGRSGPGTDFLNVFTLHEGTKVVVGRAEGRWVQVRLPNGIGGWLPDDVLLYI